MTSTTSGTSGEGIRVLVAEDEPALRRTVVRMLSARGMQVSAAEDGTRALDVLATRRFDVALLDLMMPGASGLEILEHIRSNHPDTEVVLMTAFADVDTAVKAVQRGAFNFLTKPFRSNDEVAVVIEQAAAHRNLKEQNERLQRQLGAAKVGVGRLIGSSQSMQDIFQEVIKVAATKTTVLVLGESGTGKELTARAIHEHSPRKSQPFIAVNCGTIPASLIESELFGHVKGAFTHATTHRIGLFEAAHKGTIFLDEVGDLPPQAQVSLLRVLQEGEIKRVGANETKLIDVRVLAATHVDLREKIRAGTFREDLFFRLQVVEIVLPPLRERRSDIPELTADLVERHAQKLGRSAPKVSVEAMELLKGQYWRGNVRELSNALERALVYCKNEVLPEHFSTLRGRPKAEDYAGESTLDKHNPVPLSAPILGPVLGQGLGSVLGSGVSDPPGAVSVGPASSDPVSAVNNVLTLPEELLAASYREAKEQALTMFERIYFSRLKVRTKANVSEAARLAGLDRSNFRRSVKRAGVRWRDDGESPEE